jgi:hypothetical protein
MRESHWEMTMYKLVSVASAAMIAASTLVVLGVLAYSSFLALNEFTAPTGSVSITQIEQDALPVLADAKDVQPAQSSL